MRNQYYQKMKAQRHKLEGDAVITGIEAGLNITAIALNRLFGFGDGRLSRLEKEVQRIWDEEFLNRDPTQAYYDLTRAVSQIRGKKKEP